MDLRCQNIQREEIEGLPCRCAYIIQSRPIDYPSSIVVRRVAIGRDWKKEFDRVFGLFESLDEARKSIPPGFRKRRRSKIDFSIVIETWVE